MTDVLAGPDIRRQRDEELGDGLTVLVPDDIAVSMFADVVGIRPVRYRLGEELPVEAAFAEVFVPPFDGYRTAVELLDHLPSLRLVQLPGAGADVWLDRLPPGVRLATARGAHSGSVAEWVVGALLHFYRDMRLFQRAQDAGEWRFQVTDTLAGKRVLAVGAGDLGRSLRSRLRPFGVSTTLVGRTARTGVHGRDELPDLVGSHDAVVLMVPLTAETVGLLDADLLARLPDGAIVVNVARGPVVDTGALVDELGKGRLRAALDVTDPEPLPRDHPLWTLQNVVLTPHVSGLPSGFLTRAYAVALEEVIRFRDGRPMRNLITGDY